MFDMPVNGLAINALNGCQDAMVCDALLHQTVLGLRLPCGFFCDATDCPREGSISKLSHFACFLVLQSCPAMVDKNYWALVVRHAILCVAPFAISLSRPCQ